MQVFQVCEYRKNYSADSFVVFLAATFFGAVAFSAAAFAGAFLTAGFLAATFFSVTVSADFFETTTFAVLFLFHQSDNLKQFLKSVCYS